MIRLYGFAESPNVERVSLALAYKGLRTEWVSVDPGDRSEVLRVSGQEHVPVIKDAGNVTADSTAILQYLERHYPSPALLPEAPARRAEMLVFIDWFNRVWEAVPLAIAHELEHRKPDERRLERLRAHVRGMLDLFEDLLDGRDHLMGDFSAADCAAFPFLKHAHRDVEGTSPLHVVLHEFQESLDQHPRLLAWVERVNARPRA